MCSRARSAAVLFLLLATCLPAFAQRDALPDPSKGYKWEDAAKKLGLTPDEIQQLSRDKVLVTNQAFKQVFTPYLGHGAPVFITSDSLLNAYHVLYEESVLRLERSNARKLPEVLGVIWKNLDAAGFGIKGKPELVAAARLRAKVVIGTALALLGDATIKPDAEAAKLIGEEVKRVEEARENMKPAWLGPPDDGFLALDYSRYKPRGFYMRSEPLQRYFRAVSWLQSIPFRVDRDDELLSILLLGERIGGERAGLDQCFLFFRGFSDFIGAPDDWDITTALAAARDNNRIDLAGEGLAPTRAQLHENARIHHYQPMISHTRQLPPGDPSAVADLAFRVLPAYRTPDAILFQRTTDLRVFEFRRPFPTGLEVCAALGSTWAQGKIGGQDRKTVLKIIAESSDVFRGSSLYFGYLDCLRALLDQPEPDAPAFMKTEPWRVKSCQTALAGWAQLRHTWTLQAKQTAMYESEEMVPVGFIEPEPEFFSRMAKLVERTQRELKAAGAITDGWTDVPVDIRAGADLIEAKDFAHMDNAGWRKLTRDEIQLVEHVERILHGMKLEAGLGDRTKYYAEATGRLRRLADDLEKGKLPVERDVLRSLYVMKVSYEDLWRDLGERCRRLEALAQKQLRGVPFSDEETDFIQGYGWAIARIMLYNGNAYLDPRDDAPRVVDVVYNPNVKQYLEVGISRPRAIYVLYPTKTGEILCRGAVMPYYEFPNSERLTDAEWKSLLDSDKRPDVPDWVKPIVAPGGIGVPKLDKRQ
jgi:hypothetical protein